MAGDIAQRAADYWPRMTTSPAFVRHAERRKSDPTPASTTALALFFLKTHCGCEQGCDSTAASSATVNCTALRTPSCASFDCTRESIMAEWAELRRELDDTRAELCRCVKFCTISKIRPPLRSGRN